MWLYYSSNQIDSWSGGDVARYPVGGTVSGLSGTVVLQDNGGDDLRGQCQRRVHVRDESAGGFGLCGDGEDQPPGRAGVLGGQRIGRRCGSAGVTNVAVTCTAAVTRYPVGGTVSGLSGTVVLQDNGGDDLGVSASGAFTFATSLPAGSAYAVTVKTSPAGQACSVANGSGTVGSAGATNVAVTCTASAAGSGSDNFNRADRVSWYQLDRHE